MSYISAKETARKWGISPRRVAVLAKEGKIQDAQLIGKSWLIPSYAEKPMDGRIIRKEKEKTFRFPLLAYQDFKEDDPRLSLEEQLLLKGQKLSFQGEAAESSKILKELLSSSKSKSIQIGAAYYMIYNDILLNQFEDIGKYLSLFSDENIRGPHEKELKFLQYDIESLTKGNEALLEGSSPFPLDTYAQDAIPYIASIATFKLGLASLLGKDPKDTSMFELAALTYENWGYYLASLSIYLYLSLYYVIHKDIEKAKHFARKGIRLSKEKECYSILAYCYTVAPGIFGALLEEETEEYKNTIVTIAEKLLKGTSTLMRMQNRRYVESELSELEQRLLFAAVQGMPNKEIASILQVSENTVSKKYYYDENGNKKDL